MLDFQLQQFPFRYGLAEGQDPHHVPPGTLTMAENAVWKQAGRVEKRFGTSVLVATIIGGGSIAAAKRLFTRGTELCLVNGTNLYAYSSTLASWRNVDQVPDVGLTWSTLVDTGKGVSASDIAISAAGMQVTAWVTGDAYLGSQTTGDLFVTVTDRATGSVCVPVTQIGVTASPSYGVRVLTIGTNAFVITRVAADISITSINLSTMVVNAQTVVRNDARTRGFDACVVGSTLVLAYENTANALKLYSYTYVATTTYTQAATGGITGEAGNSFFSIAIDGASGGSIFVAYTVATTGQTRVAQANDSTLAQTVAPVSTIGSAANNVGVVRVSSTTCIVVGSRAVSPGGRVESVEVIAGVVTATSQRGTSGTTMVSRPFAMGGKYYAVLLDYPVASLTGGSAFPGTNTCLVELETSTIGSLGNYVPHRYVGRIDVLIGGQSTVGMVAGIAAVSATETVVCSPFLATVPPAAVNWRCGLRLVSVTTGTSRPADLWRSCSGGQEAYVAGAVLSAYDGQSCFDYGFARSPHLYNVSTFAGGSMAAGDYLWGGHGEYRSASGMLYRSPVSVTTVPLTVPGGGTATVNVNFVNCVVQSKLDVANGGLASSALPIRIAVHRSTVGGSTLQRETNEPLYNVLTQDPLLQTTSFADTFADADIGGSIALASQPAIYTTGGILDDHAPVGSVTMFRHADRLWVLAGDQRTWWYSKAFQDDLGVAPGFHPNFRIAFESQQVAGATMDDKAIFFGLDGVRYLLGLGPTAAGLNSDFGPPVAIQSDVGCNNARSVVGTPDGIMFGSDRGIYLLTRGFELVWIGRPVKDKLASFPTITSAVLVPKQNQVRFTCTTTLGTTGITLVYDYVEKQWSTFTHTIGGVYGGAIADACMWNGAYTFVSTAGSVHVESTSSYLDAGASYVPMTLETSWIAAAGPLAFHSVRSFQLHGTSYTDHDLTITVGFDSNTTYQQTATWLGTSAVTAVGDEDANVIINTRRKCNTIRFKVVDSTPTTGTVGTGRGPSWDSMGLEVGVKRGFGNAPATKRA
jgi:hypothetical protein